MATRRPGRQNPGRRVPLDRLSTKRFKTLDQRYNDNARRRAKREVEAVDPDSWEATKEAKQDYGHSWNSISEYTDAINERRRRYAGGQRDFSDDDDLPDRPEGVPPEAGYYKLK